MKKQKQIEVYPDKAGEWRWRRRAANGKISADSGEGYSARGSAIEAARAERGDTKLTEVRDDGTEAGVRYERGDDERIVLLRADGSMHGELSPPAPVGGAQTVDLEPATENGEA